MTPREVVNVEPTRVTVGERRTARIGRLMVAVVSAGVVTLLAAGAAEAQSLADVARREAERRATIKQSGKVLTNADLPASAVTESPRPVAEDTAASAGEESPGATAAGDGESAKSGDKAPADNEDGWRARAAQVNKALADARGRTRQLRALSDRLALEMQASNPEIVARATKEREDLRGSLAEAQAAEDEAFAARQSLEQEARVAGVPAAWLQ